MNFKEACEHLEKLAAGRFYWSLEVRACQCPPHQAILEIQYSGSFAGTMLPKYDPKSEKKYTNLDELVTDLVAEYHQSEARKQREFAKLESV